MQFANPEILWLLVLLPLWAGWIWWQNRQKEEGLQYSSVAVARNVPRTLWTYLQQLPLALRMGALILGIIALARPQDVNQRVERHTEGIDIMMVLDISTSMRAEDFQPNRFEAARDVAREFVDSRTSDRVGLIAFAAEAYTQTPLTIDYDFLQRMMERVEIGMIKDGTAIGTALATAVNRLKDSEAETKVIILLTDGQNNQGEIDPTTAAEVAETMRVRVYTIGVGSHGSAPYSVNRPFGGQRQVQMPVRIDEEMLTTVAQTTDGKYFRATDKSALRTIYDEIDKLEQTEIQEEVYTDYQERYAWFAWPALALVLLEVLLNTTRLRRFP